MSAGSGRELEPDDKVNVASFIRSLKTHLFIHKIPLYPLFIVVVSGQTAWSSWLPAASQPALDSASLHCKPAAVLEGTSTDQTGLWPAPVRTHNTF